MAHPLVSVCPRLRWCSMSLWLLGLTAVLCGCSGEAGPPRKPVFGTVTGSADSSFEGAISFLPQPGTKGPSATTAVVKGKYQFAAAGGPVPGKYQVLIVPKATKSFPQGNSAGSKDNRPVVSDAKEFQLETTVPDKDPFELNFKLTP